MLCVAIAKKQMKSQYKRILKEVSTPSGLMDIGKTT